MCIWKFEFARNLEINEVLLINTNLSQSLCIFVAQLCKMATLGKVVISFSRYSCILYILNSCIVPLYFGRFNLTSASIFRVVLWNVFISPSKSIRIFSKQQRIATMFAVNSLNDGISEWSTTPIVTTRSNKPSTLLLARSNGPMTARIPYLISAQALGFWGKHWRLCYAVFCHKH